MGELREKMLRRMELRNFSAKTRKLYLWHMEKFVKYYKTSPGKLTKVEIEDYLHYLLKSKTSSSAMAQAYSSLKFFYSECLERHWELDKIPRPKTEKRLPIVLTPLEVKSIIEETRNRKYKTLFMVIYSAGLRLSEGLSLKIKDIDSKRMTIRIEQGKGKKDRYTILSYLMLKKLREYYKEYKPEYWLFPGKNNNRVSNSTVQRAFKNSKKKPVLVKMPQFIPLGIVLPLTY